jgi:glycosyltransferase involved in cell wall biosynthesis
MRIACVGTGWYPRSPGGLEKYVYGMTRSLVRAGEHVDLFVTGETEPNDTGGRLFSIGNTDDALWKRARDARKMFSSAMRGPYDVINIHFAMNALPLIPFIDRGTPRVVHFHGPWAAESRAEGGGGISVAIKRALERFVYHRADRFIVLSTAFKEILVGYGVDAARVAVIPMGIDTDFFRPSADRRRVRADLGWPMDTTVFFTARRLINRVGLHELIRAAQLVRAQTPNFVLKIAGRGPLHDELQSSIASLGLSECVELLGFVSEEDLVKAYQAADVTLLPSQALEGFGTIISESLACGTPVIVTPIGGMPEAVAPLGTQLIARSASSADIAERMEAALRRSLTFPDRDACRAFALEHYDWDLVAARIKTVFANARA